MKETMTETGEQKAEASQEKPPKYWLSLEQWRNDEDFQRLANQEFLSNPLSSEDGQGGWARREFLKLMGASMALTSFGCVRRPAQKIIPYAKRPKDVVPGKANHYASSFVDGNVGYGIVVTTREGRPIKVEGNQDHPVNRGGMSARAHAHILALYDPDRLTGPVQNLLNEKKTNRETIGATWEGLDKDVVDTLKKGKTALLTGEILSPSLRSLVKDFSSGFKAKHFVWSPLNDEVIRQGQKVSYGQAVSPRYRLDKAERVLAVDCDFLGTDGSVVEMTRQFGQGRAPGDHMNRLVVFESLLSLTGSNADQRFRIKPSQQLDVLMGLLYEIVVEKKKSRYASDSQVKAALEPFKKAYTHLQVEQSEWQALAEDLWAYRGKGLVLAGGVQGQTDQATSVQVAANFFNSVLENDGVSVDASYGYTGRASSTEGLNQLLASLKSGEVKTLIIHGVNPGYCLPQQAGLLEALQAAEMVIYTGDRVDETGGYANYVAPDHHSMEAWGDGEFVKGVYSVQQPTIQPLGKTRAFGDSLLEWMKQASVGSSQARSQDSWYDYVKSFWKNHIHSSHRSGNLGSLSFEKFWEGVLHEGVFDTTSGALDKVRSSRSFQVQSLKRIEKKAITGDELALYATVGLRDGSLANVPWLQEFPDPVTKICWDNYVCVSPARASKENWTEGQVIALSSGSTSLQVPVHIQPGAHDEVLALAVGYGRRKAGVVANGVGVNAYEMAHLRSDSMEYAGRVVQLKTLKKRISLANVQGHHSMEGRQIVIEATLAQVKKDPGANIHRHKMMTMWSEHKYPGHKWGMVIDLNSCTGCSACMIACQSENNIPTVGKRFVLQGREMHWLRLDRYYTGKAENPRAVVMPVVCQHCDNAPCETVCPVVATVHSSEGTNDMIYNRCVGTRYCANNCPYKVRRFNWFDYTKLRSPLQMALNPEVTVRDRGVMEKCTFCKHRIMAARSELRVEDKALKDGDVITACQQSCPTGAIVFGDLNDEKSKVAGLFHQKRSYELLEELNNQTAVKYQTKIRNVDRLNSEHEHNGHGKGHHS